jgi:hypothetical protein
MHFRWGLGSKNPNTKCIYFQPVFLRISYGPEKITKSSSREQFFRFQIGNIGSKCPEYHADFRAGHTFFSVSKKG